MQLGVGEELIEQYVVRRHAVELCTTSPLVDVGDNLRVVDGDGLADEVCKYSLEGSKARWRWSGHYLTGWMHDREEERRICPLQSRVPTTQAWTAEMHSGDERWHSRAVEWKPDAGHAGLGLSWTRCPACSSSRRHDFQA